MKHAKAGMHKMPNGKMMKNSAKEMQSSKGVKKGAVMPYSMAQKSKTK